VVGGNFAVNRATVGGYLSINGGGTYTLGPSAIIGDNLKIQNIPPGGACLGGTAPIMRGGNTASKITGQCNAGATAATAQSSRVPDSGNRQF
jgi:hypothetical protein